MIQNDEQIVPVVYHDAQGEPGSNYPDEEMNTNNDDGMMTVTSSYGVTFAPVPRDFIGRTTERRRSASPTPGKRGDSFYGPYRKSARRRTNSDERVNEARGRLFAETVSASANVKIERERAIANVKIEHEKLKAKEAQENAKSNQNAVGEVQRLKLEILRLRNEHQNIKDGASVKYDSLVNEHALKMKGISDQHTQEKTGAENKFNEVVAKHAREAKELGSKLTEATSNLWNEKSKIGNLESKLNDAKAEVNVIKSAATHQIDALKEERNNLSSELNMSNAKLSDADLIDKITKQIKSDLRLDIGKGKGKGHAGHSFQERMSSYDQSIGYGEKINYRELISTKPTKELFEKVRFPKLQQDSDGTSLAKVREFLHQIQEVAVIISHSEGSATVKEVRVHVFDLHSSWVELTDAEKIVFCATEPDLTPSQRVIEKYLMSFLLKQFEDHESLQEHIGEDEEVTLTSLVLYILQHVFIGTGAQLQELSQRTLEFPIVKSTGDIEKCVLRWKRDCELSKIFNGYLQPAAQLFAAVDTAMKPFIKKADFTANEDISEYRRANNLKGRGVFKREDDNLKKITNFGKFVGAVLHVEAQHNNRRGGAAANLSSVMPSGFVVNTAQGEGGDGGDMSGELDGSGGAYVSVPTNVPISNTKTASIQDTVSAAVFAAFSKGKGKGKGSSPNRGNHGGTFPPPRTTRIKGTCVRWEGERGFGFIMPSREAIDKYAKNKSIYSGEKPSWLFAHFGAIKNAAALKVGDLVEFEVSAGRQNSTDANNLKAIRIVVQGAPAKAKTGPAADAVCKVCNGTGHFPDQCDKYVDPSKPVKNPVLICGCDHQLQNEGGHAYPEDIESEAYANLSKEFEEVQDEGYDQSEDAGGHMFVTSQADLGDEAIPGAGFGCLPSFQ